MGATALAQPAAPEHAWTMLAGSPDRSGTSPRIPPSLATPAWAVSLDDQGRSITFIAQAGVVCSRESVFAAGSVVISSQKQFSIYAINRRSGQIRWSRPIAAPAADSWSSPTIDERNGTILTTSGKTVAACDMLSGQPRWSVTLPRTIVNASALVTADLGVANRLFITQFDGFGEQGLLTCINIDPAMGLANPFAPGQVVWSAPIGGSSGNSPAYADGVVYCAAVGVPEVAGSIVAFDARTVADRSPLWSHIEEGHGFFGGVSVRADGLGLWVYAASYDFDGGIDASRLVKLNALDGTPVWEIPCNRTASTPIVLDDGRIVLSGGIAGYGTVPTIEIFSDHGATVSAVWNSALDTWTDTNGNDSIDIGEFLPLGGWCHTPVALRSTNMLLTGTLALTGNIGSTCTDLSLLDLSRLPPLGSPDGPLDRSFVAHHFAGGGSTPAIADGNIYTIGAGGLLAFGVPPALVDVDSSGAVDIDDLYAWEQGRGQRDVDFSGTVDAHDHALVIAAVRERESDGAAGVER